MSYFPLNRPIPKTPPTIASGTWVNKTGGGHALGRDLPSGGIELVAIPNGAGTNSRHLLTWAAPSAPYTLTAQLNCSFWPGSNPGIAGLVLYESGTQKGLEWDLYWVTTTFLHWNYGKFATPSTSFSAYSDVSIPGLLDSSNVFLEMRNDGTNITSGWSVDGIGWNRVHTPLALTTPFTTAPNYYGLIIDNTSADSNTTAYTVNGATNASPIVLSFTANHSLRTGDVVTVASVGGNTAANGDWFVTYVDQTHVSLDGSTGNGSWTSGGTATLHQILTRMSCLSLDITVG